MSGGCKMGMFFAGFLMAFVVLFVGGWMYLKWGHPPVAASDTAFPMKHR